MRGRGRKGGREGGGGRLLGWRRKGDDVARFAFFNARNHSKKREEKERRKRERKREREKERERFRNYGNFRNHRKVGNA